jgi:hypothetical protein
MGIPAEPVFLDVGGVGGDDDADDGEFEAALRALGNAVSGRNMNGVG